MNLIRPFLSARGRIFSATCISILVFFQPVSAQSQEKIYALMLLNFARNIDWPATNSGHFVIGVLEYLPLVEELKSVTRTVKINGRTLNVKPLTNPFDVKGCQIVFLPAYKARWLTPVLETIPSEATLIVSNKAGLARNGSAINFILLEGKLNYEINCDAIEKRGLKVGKALKTTGILIEN